MRRSGLFLLLVFGVVEAAVAQDDPPGRVGRLNYISGAVSFQPGGVDEWVGANLNRPLTTGDRLWVDQDARAEMHVGGSAVRMTPRTAFQFLNLTDQTVQISVAEGSIEVRLRALGPDQVFEVDTPNLAYTLLRPGTYRIDVNPNSQTTIVTARNGQAEVTGGGQAFQVQPREQARVTGEQNVTYDIGPAPPPDWFDTFCDSRDRREDQSQSARFVSRDMTGYEDLDGAGDWRPAPEYGNVWYPRAMPAGWAPYRYGHWAWVEPWGWTWVDDAAWGFAPFHYGRWAFISGNWGWIPGPVAVRPVYAPALVAFVGGPRFSLSLSIGGGGGGVAWFPLGPREVYMPAYHASPNYVNRVNTTNTVITNVNITNVYNNTNVTNIRYVNQSAPGAVTAVTRETFVGARPVGQARVEVRAETLASAQVIRTSGVAPAQSSVLGHSVMAQNVAHPPQAVMARQVVARTAAPAPQVPFQQRQQLLQQNGGQPLDAAQLQRVRSQNAVPVRALVRQANVPQGGGQQAAPFVRPNGAPGQQVQPQPNAQQPGNYERRGEPPTQPNNTNQQPPVRNDNRPAPQVTQPNQQQQQPGNFERRAVPPTQPNNTNQQPPVRNDNRPAPITQPSPQPNAQQPGNYERRGVPSTQPNNTNQQPPPAQPNAPQRNAQQPGNFERRAVPPAQPNNTNPQPPVRNDTRPAPQITQPPPQPNAQQPGNYERRPVPNQPPPAINPERVVERPVTRPAAEAKPEARPRDEHPPARKDEKKPEKKDDKKDEKREH